MVELGSSNEPTTETICFMPKGKPREYFFEDRALGTITVSTVNKSTGAKFNGGYFSKKSTGV